MARIKCRYMKFMCSYDHTVKEGEEYDCGELSCCSDYLEPERIIANDGRLLIEDTCSHSYTIDVEFEKSYKEYEYNELGLFLGRRRRLVPYDNIEYLEIDDRILVNEEV